MESSCVRQKQTSRSSPRSLFPSFLCFWVFDIICYNSNRRVAELSLLNRLHLIRTSVVSPLHSLQVVLPFQMRMKPMYNLEQTVFVWQDVVQHLTHECDGLIFTPIRDAYKAGVCLKLLKWKPVYLNSADFKIYLCYTSISFDVSASR